MSIITSIMNNLSAEDKEKLGRVGTKINTDGEHLLTIVEAYEIASEGGVYPRFTLKCEDGEGKTIDWSGFLKAKVSKDDKGVVKAGEYSVNGVKTYLDKEGAEYDDLKVVGQIKNLWKICGLDPKQFGAGVRPSTVTFPSKGTVAIESFVPLIGKQFTGVSHYIIVVDEKDPAKAWRNQELDMNTLFTANGLSAAEQEAGKTEGTALALAVKAALARKADASKTIKGKDKNQKACLQEWKLLQSSDKIPIVEAVPTISAGSPF